MKKGQILTITVLSLFVLLSGATSLPLPNWVKQAVEILPSSAVGPVTVATSGSTLGALKNPSNRLVCYSNGYYFAFYYNGTASGTNQLYSSSQTGASWASPSTIVSGIYNGAFGYPTFSVYCDGSGNVYATWEISATQFDYRQWTSSAGVLTAAFAALALTCTDGGAFCADYSSIYAFDTSHVWIALGSDTSGGTHFMEIWACQTSSCGTGGNWADKRQDSTNTCGEGCYIQGLSSNQKIAIATQTSAGGKIVYVSTSNGGTSFSAATSTATSYQELFVGNCIAITDTIHCVTTDAATQETLYYISFALGGGSWTETGIATTATAVLVSGMTISSDGTNVVVAYAISTSAIDTITSTNGGTSWGSATSLVTGETATAASITSTPTLQTTVAGVLWQDGSKHIRFATSASLSITTFFTITCTVASSGATATNTLAANGGGTLTLSSTSNTCNGSAQHYSLNWVGNSSDITFTLTVPSDGANTRYRFSGPSTTFTTSQLANTTYTITEYEQNHSTWQYAIVNTAGTGFSAPSLSITYAGGSNSTGLTTSPQGIWADISKAWNATNPLTGSGANERWRSTNAAGTVGDGGQTITVNYYNQNHTSFDYAIIGSSSGSSAPNLAITYFGGANSTILTTSFQGIWADVLKAWNSTNPLTGSSGTERWNANVSSGTIHNGGTSITITYNQQWFLTITTTPAGSTNGTSEFINNANSLKLLATPAGPFLFLSWSCSGAGCFAGTSNPTGLFTMNNAITEAPHFSGTFSNKITIQWYIAGNISVTINMVRQNLGAALNSTNYILASYTQAGNSMTANLVDGTNTIIVDNNTLVTINSNSSLSAGGAEQWCLDNCIPNSFTPNHNQTVTEDYWIQDFISYRWVPPVACSFVCTLVHPIVVSTGFSDLQNTQLSDSDGTTVPTSFVSVWIDNNTKWNSSNPFVYDLQNWIPNNTGTTINFGPQLVTLAYTGGGTNSSCTSQNTFLDLLTGCWTGTFVYTWTPILGQFGMGAIFMFIDVALYLKTENPMVALLLMVAEGAGVGFLLPAFFAPLTAIFLAVGITGSLFNLIRNR